ncbi:MAG: hypothetical protein JJE52_04370 [Acidimicrobiia bacterium]|nr:hypothetical protein [Acidimicrobiia bacterium]
MPRRHQLSALIAMTILSIAMLVACGDDRSEQGAATPTNDASAGSTSESTAQDDVDDDTEPGDDTDPGDGELPDACSLLDPAELSPLVGDVEPEAESGTAIDMLDFSQCAWETDDTMVVVAVRDGPARYEMHRDNLPSEPVDGLGDEAVTMAGVSSETVGATGGRTVSALVGGRTVVVALRIEGQTTLDVVRPLAQAAIERAR